MQETQLISKSIISQVLDYNLPLLRSFQVKKVAAVALGCIGLFGVQMGLTWAVTAGISFACTTLSLLSESFLRQGQSQNTNWLRVQRPKPNFLFHIALHLTVFPLIVALSTACGSVPAQGVAKLILSGNIRTIFLATTVAPITEEIFFRGFIQERLEDITTLINRYIYPITNSTKEFGSSVIQSIFFGALHITGTQVAGGLCKKLIVLLQTTLFGYYMTKLKNENRSLLPGIAMHSAQNTGVTLGLLASKLIKIA